MKTRVFALSALLLTVIVGCDASTLSKSGSPTSEPSPIVLTGSGKTATDKFQLAGGMTVFRFKYEGTGNFIAWLHDDTGAQKALVANEIGATEGSQGYGAKAGAYSLDVTGNASWSVRIEQPRPSDASASTSFSGTGNTLAGPFKMSAGSRKFSYTYAGEGNYIVWLLDSEGAQKALVANEVGSSTGSKTHAGTNGIFYLNVTAKGPWTINLE